MGFSLLFILLAFIVLPLLFIKTPPAVLHKFSFSKKVHFTILPIFILILIVLTVLSYSPVGKQKEFSSTDRENQLAQMEWDYYELEEQIANGEAIDAPFLVSERTHSVKEQLIIQANLNNVPSVYIHRRDDQEPYIKETFYQPPHALEKFDFDADFSWPLPKWSENEVTFRGIENKRSAKVVIFSDESFTHQFINRQYANVFPDYGFYLPAIVHLSIPQDLKIEDPKNIIMNSEE